MLFWQNLSYENKCCIPFKECEFELLFAEGLNPYTGVLKQMEADGEVERSGAWYSVMATGKKFQSKEFVKLMQSPVDEGFAPLAKFLDF